MCCAISTTKWFWQGWAGAEPKMHLGQSSEIPMGGFFAVQTLLEMMTVEPFPGLRC